MKHQYGLASAKGFRSLNYQQLGDKLADGCEFEIVWSDFLHAFFDYKDASFFAYPPPESLSPGWQAILQARRSGSARSSTWRSPNGSATVAIPSPRLGTRGACVRTSTRRWPRSRNPSGSGMCCLRRVTSSLSNRPSLVSRNCRWWAGSSPTTTLLRGAFLVRT